MSSLSGNDRNSNAAPKCKYRTCLQDGMAMRSCDTLFVSPPMVFPAEMLPKTKRSGFTEMYGGSGSSPFAKVRSKTVRESDVVIDAWMPAATNGRTDTT